MEWNGMALRGNKSGGIGTRWMEGRGTRQEVDAGGPYDAGGGVWVIEKCGCLRRAWEEGGDKDRVCNAMRRRTK